MYGKSSLLAFMPLVMNVVDNLLYRLEYISQAEKYKNRFGF